MSVVMAKAVEIAFPCISRDKSGEKRLRTSNIELFGRGGQSGPGRSLGW